MMVIDERAKPEDVPLMPGETHVFKLPKTYVEGWNWYRTGEKKPHPKKIGFIFHELNFGDGTGFTGTGGDPVPGKRSSIKGKRRQLTPPEFGAAATHRIVLPTRSPHAGNLLAGKFLSGQIRRSHASSGIASDVLSGNAMPEAKNSSRR